MIHWPTTKVVLTVIALIGLVTGTAAGAKTLTQARAGAIGWLETNQNEDGSWGSGDTQDLVTAEALLALARANRAAGTPARRAQAWLLNREYPSLDYQARAIRALEAAGVDMAEAATAMSALAGSSPGWGAVPGAAVTSYDTALVLGATYAALVTPPGLSTKLSEVFARRRPDNGWSGDRVNEGTAPSASDRTMSGEIVRALSLAYPGSTWASSSTPFSVQRFLSTATANGGAAVSSSSDTLELASRLAALHAVGQTDDHPTTGLETELLRDARFQNGAVWSTDPYVNAIGLLAVTTKPGVTTFTPACPNNSDCDSALDSADAFPFSDSETADLDRDGVGDIADRDRDGDGFCDSVGSSGPACVGTDAFETDPTESANHDADSLGDNEDPDDDNDGKLDVDEFEQGTNPTVADSDSDGSSDSVDPCPLIAGGTDLDGDDVCAPLDECDNPSEPLAASAVDTKNTDRDLPGSDLLCDGADPDDDGDGFDDGIEIVWGSDPRDPASHPESIVASDPSGDFDLDGLSNDAEATHSDPSKRTNPYLADSDGDGAVDGEELGSTPATHPNNPLSRPLAKIAVMSSAGAAQPVPSTSPFAAELTGAGLRATATGGQPTPIARVSVPHSASQGPDAISLAGFQPQTSLGRDFDGDGLSGRQEAQLATSPIRVDSDGDRFVDGDSDLIAKAIYTSGFDLDGDGYIEGEGSIGTDPASGDDHPGMAGDVAPLGFPNGVLDTADFLIGVRLGIDPSLLSSLNADAEELTKGAADLDEDGEISAGEVLSIRTKVKAANP